MLKPRKFDVEHALGLYALSYVTVPAEGLYDTERLKEFKVITDKCHIYVVGLVPRTKLDDVKLEGTNLRMSFGVLGKSYDLVWVVDEGVELMRENEHWFLSKNGRQASLPGLDNCAIKLNEKFGTGKFLVKYIGQAYGKDGSRNALDRLLKHEKLQEIAIKGAPDGFRFQILMLVMAENQVITAFYPRTEDESQGAQRIKQGIAKLFGTSEKERVALYEAALIRYFQPEFNREFIDSFPSTNLKILQDCYDKDFAAVSAEILFENFPFTLYSEAVEAKDHHLAYFDLHDDEMRRAFFAE